MKKIITLDFNNLFEAVFCQRGVDITHYYEFELNWSKLKVKKESLTDSTTVSTLKRRKKIEPRSWVWQSQNVVKINESSDKCNICQQVITIYNSSTIELFLILPEVEKELSQN
ncbi:hypothetical protein BpHYR1_016007 [Brachionus plicatilis]|uniref:Uncharacterized protein n=1 Tax=Brachionus plicatilis TaxID=10195 RepID=A0A3M7TAM7_BRAPC|nr:hypothetical protein BpHYR1_016007 [Brachionus plicatilis]